MMLWGARWPWLALMAAAPSTAIASDGPIGTPEQMFLLSLVAAAVCVLPVGLLLLIGRCRRCAWLRFWVWASIFIAPLPYWPPFPMTTLYVLAMIVNPGDLRIAHMLPWIPVSIVATFAIGAAFIVWRVPRDRDAQVDSATSISGR